MDESSIVFVDANFQFDKSKKKTISSFGAFTGHFFPSFQVELYAEDTYASRTLDLDSNRTYGPVRKVSVTKAFSDFESWLSYIVPKKYFGSLVLCVMKKGLLSDFMFSNMKNHRVLADAFSGEVIELEAVISDKLKIHSDTILPVSLMLFPKVRKTTEKYADLPGRRAYMMHSVYFKLFDKI